jgi:signal transduction histidine kinase/CheY-like chemotaxis protein
MLPIRRLLLRDLLVLMAGLSALILGLSWWSQQHALGYQVKARTQAALHHLDTVLRMEMQASQALGQVVQGWWVEGALDPAQPEAAAHLVLPLLAAQHSITSLNLARADGRSLLFLRLGGVWSLRELIQAGPQAQIRWHRLGQPGDTPKVEAWVPMDYDPRVRPWYRAGASSPTPVWTEPYVFFTSRDPGITCTFPVRNASGLQGVAALDFLLDDLTTQVWASQPTPRSRCLVTDAQGRALILPNDPAFHTVEARRAAFLKPLEGGVLETQSRMFAAADQIGQPFWVRLRGEAMVGLVMAFHDLPGIQWRFLLTVPEEDLLGPVRARIWSLLALAILSLLLAVWRIRLIAQRVAGPITQLGATAEALGQGQALPPTQSQILEIRSLDRALRQANESLANQAKLQRQLEHSQRMETVGTLAGGIAHDVNNQLAAILGQLHLCREMLPEGHPVLARIQRAEEATRRSAQTTKALLSFSHRSQPELRSMDLNAQVSDTAAILDRLLGGRIRLTLSLMKDLPPIAGDPVQLEQVLMNLSVNARDAMPQGGDLNLRTYLEADGQVGLEVQDSGHGIPETLLPHIFEPFITTKDMGKGTGLGLAMVFGIVKAHQGRIRADNPPGGGARFRISLPPAEEGAWNPPTAHSKIVAAGARLAGRRVLLVEDEIPLRDLLADALTLARIQVTAAPDGLVAWRAWNAGTFDLILSDQRMPDCTGMELLERIRSSGSKVPFILASGQGLEGFEEDLARDGRLRLLPKPFELPRLMALMEDMLTSPA